MDSNYLIQRKINARRQYRRKVTLAITLAIVLVVVIIIGLVMVMMKEGKSDTGDSGRQNQTSDKLTPGSGKNQEKEEAAPTLTATPTLTPTATPTPTPTPVPVTKVAIDPGHGGVDKGSNRGEHYEKDANLAISLFLKEYLLAEGYEVYMIREEDTTIDKKERPAMAIEENVDLYVSVHINSYHIETDDVQGAVVLYSDARADKSNVLAQNVVDELSALVGMRNRGTDLRNDLVVIRTSEAPSCLVECGFISSPAEREKLFSEDYQKQVARGIANGIMKFIPAVQEVEEPQEELSNSNDTATGAAEN